MLENLRRILDNDNREEEVAQMMLESSDSTVEDMFIEEDGEAEMSDNELSSILNKIPAYDEEDALDKKLSKIAESYIPEEI